MIIKTVQNPTQGLKIAKTLLYKYVDGKTVLFLSGGTTPKPLYKILAKEKKLRLGGAGLVDERFGFPNHENSNERMIRDTGLLSYLEEEKIPFYGILQDSHRHSGKLSEAKRISSSLSLRAEGQNHRGDSGLTSFARMTLEQAARVYGKTVDNLFTNFPKKIAIMGIGEDGHTAGLPARTQNSKVKSQKYVTEINNFPGEFKKRITLTFKALSKMDLLIILVFGSAKQNALNLMFRQGSEEEIPARFYTQPAIARQTILITDQKV